MSKISVTRYHDFSMGHCVTGHKLIDDDGNETTVNGGCYNLHGHNYRIHFTLEAWEDKLDNVGRVLDFNVIKGRLCMWLERNWDHRFLISKHDERADGLVELNPEGVLVVEFNPTAENLGDYLLRKVAPVILAGTDCTLTKVVIEETRKCSATIEL